MNEIDGELSLANKCCKMLSFYRIKNRKKYMIKLQKHISKANRLAQKRGLNIVYNFLTDKRIGFFQGYQIYAEIRKF